MRVGASATEITSVAVDFKDADDKLCPTATLHQRNSAINICDQRSLNIRSMGAKSKVSFATNVTPECHKWGTNKKSARSTRSIVLYPHSQNSGAAPLVTTVS